jgi:uncharacterized protein with NRDE domain
VCLIAFNFRPSGDPFLVLAANRDEFHERPSRPLSWWRWPEGPLAGRDERAGGTWIAVDRGGRWAAVTNFRDPDAEGGRRSRGELPLRFLDGDLDPERFVSDIHASRSEYGPFNLLAGNRGALWYCSTHGGPEAVGAGVHALSNGPLDAPWPKSRRVATALRGLDTADHVDIGRLFGLMDDREPAADGDLPDTGVGTDIERFLSPPFIVGERYGTRCTTVASLGERCRVVERGFDRQGVTVSALDYGFDHGP